MAMLWVASGAWLFLHFVVSGTRLRSLLTSVLGENAYLGVYSLASVASLAWLAFAYRSGREEGNQLLWDLGPGVTHLGLLIVGIAFVFGLPGVLMPSPTAVGQGALASNPNTATGVLRITRHPFLWSVALWALFHMAANGDAASVLFFGTLFVVAVGGTFSIDAKRARQLGAQWVPFAQATSNVPFAAILSGRQEIVLREFATWRQAVAFVIFAVVALFHHVAFGVSPFPGGWTPF